LGSRGPVGIVVGNFGGDARNDFATVNEFSDDMTVLLRVGIGQAYQYVGIAASVPIDPTAQGHKRMILGDFNNDGVQDIATASFDATPNLSTVYIFFGTGTGVFQPVRAW